MGAGQYVYEQYVWDIRYIDAPVYRLRDDSADGNGTYNSLDELLYYLTDANMNVTAVMDADATTWGGFVVERYTYDPYGRVTAWDEDFTNSGDPLESEDNRILFAGYIHTPETGLYLARMRYYHPLLGRWTTRDPIGYVSALTLYQYCIGNPLGLVDPLGLDEHDPMDFLRFATPPGLPTGPVDASPGDPPTVAEVETARTSEWHGTRTPEELARLDEDSERSQTQDSGSVGEELRTILVLRALQPGWWGVLLTRPELWVDNHQEIHDDRGQMMTVDDNIINMDRFYERFVESEYRGNGWQRLYIAYQQVESHREAPSSRERSWNFEFGEGDDTAAFLLHGTFGVYAQGSLEACKGPDGVYRIRNIDVQWEWHDTIDAHSWNQAEAGTPWPIRGAEAGWDLIFDGVLDTEFDVVVHWSDRTDHTPRPAYDVRLSPDE